MIQEELILLLPANDRLRSHNVCLSFSHTLARSSSEHFRVMMMMMVLLVIMTLVKTMILEMMTMIDHLAFLKPSSRLHEAFSSYTS